MCQTPLPDDNPLCVLKPACVTTLLISSTLKCVVIWTALTHVPQQALNKVFIKLSSLSVDITFPGFGLLTALTHPEAVTSNILGLKAYVCLIYVLFVSLRLLPLYRGESVCGV